MDERNANKWIIVLKGLPGSGKTTFANKLKTKLNYYYISKDVLRFNENNEYIFEKKNEKLITEKYNQILNNALNVENIILIDNLNLSENNFIELSKNAKINNYKILLIQFINNDFNLLSKNNSHNVSEFEIKKMAKHMNKDFLCDNKITFYNYETDINKVIEMIKNERKYKRTNIESDLILNEITELYLNSYSRKQIIQYCSENHDIGERQVDNYLAKVYDFLANNISENKNKMIKQSLKRFNDLYEKNTSIQDYRECRQVQESIIRLFGLNPAQKVDHTTNGKDINIPIIQWESDEGKDS